MINQLRSTRIDNRPTDLSTIGHTEHEPRRAPPLSLRASDAREDAPQDAALTAIDPSYVPPTHDRRAERRAAAMLAGRPDLVEAPLRAPSGPVDRRRPELPSYPHVDGPMRKRTAKQGTAATGWRRSMQDPIVRGLVAAAWLDVVHETPRPADPIAPLLPNATPRKEWPAPPPGTAAPPPPAMTLSAEQIALARRPREIPSCTDRDSPAICGRGCKCLRTAPAAHPRRSPSEPFVIVDGPTMRKHALGMLPFGDWRARLRAEITAALCMPSRLRPRPEDIVIPECPGAGLGEILRRIAGEDWSRVTLGHGGGSSRKRSVDAVVCEVAKQIGDEIAVRVEVAAAIDQGASSAEKIRKTGRVAEKRIPGALAWLETVGAISNDGSDYRPEYR